MSVVGRVIAAVSKKAATTKTPDRRVRMKVTKSVGMFVAEETYLVDPHIAVTANRGGWAEIPDAVRGLNEAHASSNAMAAALVRLGQTLADGKKAADAEFMGRN